MRISWLAGVAWIAIFFAVPERIAAHHGYAAFDQTKTVTLKGVVNSFFYTNPHSVVEFDVKDDNGQVRKWHGELTSPSHLAPRGWTATTLEPGDEITVSGFVTKNGTASMWVHKITTPRGKDLTVDGSN